MQGASVSLFRLLGAVGFIACGLGTLYGANSAFHVNVNFNEGFGDLSSKGWALMIGSVIAGLVGMLIGWGIAAGVKVVNDETDFVIANLWHYTANGMILWWMIMSLALTIMIGKDESKEFLRHFGMLKASFELMTIGTAGSLLMAVWLMFIGLIKYQRSKPIIAIVLAIPVGLWMGYHNLHLLGLTSQVWILLGILQAVILVPFSGFMVMRDSFQREQLQRRQE